MKPPSIPMINIEIIQQRQQRAPELKAIADSCVGCAQALQDLKVATQGIDGATGPLLKDIDSAVQSLDAVRARAERRHERFSNGLITIAVAGLEKSGKTTLLKTLTGIQDLPTDSSRCTAVPCEIIYDSSRQVFDLEFHTKHSFVEEVVCALVDGFNSTLSQDEKQYRIPVLPDSLDAFRTMQLPAHNFTKGTDSEKSLSPLKMLKEKYAVLLQHLDKSPDKGLPLSELSKWVALQNEDGEKARIATVKNCRIYTDFLGGSGNLRWLDTPGVDDPSPLARERTMRSIDREADFLLVATRPEGKPDITSSFTRFWTSLNRLPQEVALLRKLRVFLNWQEGADPSKEFIEKHRNSLVSDAGVPPSNFSGPFQAINNSDMSALMSEVNAHLSSALPSQDSETIRQIRRDYQSVMAQIRTNVYDRARKIHPGDSSQSDQEHHLFHEWFNCPSSTGQSEGFIPRLRSIFQASVEQIEAHPRVKEAQEELLRLLQEKQKLVQSQLPKAADMSRIRKENAGLPPIFSAMQIASQSTYSDIINELSKQVRAFGPIMQNILLGILRDAGLGNLIPQTEPKDALMQFCKKLREGMLGDTNAALIALEDVATLQDSLQYVYRYEMRPAVNLFNSLLWSDGKPADALASLLESNGKATWATEVRTYFKEKQLPGMQSSDQEHADVFAEMNKRAFQGIGSIIQSGRCRFATIADDVLRDSQYRLTFSEVSTNSWMNLLSPLRSDLLGESIQSLRRNSVRVAAFREKVVALESTLPS